MSENKKISDPKLGSRDAMLDALFSDAVTDSIKVVDLPSRGKFYTGYQGVEVSPLTYIDEQRILTTRGPDVDIVSKLLEKSIQGVDIDDLLSMDKTFLLMKVREASYGDMYQFSITCPACDTSIKTELELSKHLNMNQVPEDFEDPREITLPILKVKAKVRFPRSKEEVFMKNAEQVYTNLFRFVEEINGNADPVFIGKAIKRMQLQDIKKLISEITKGDYGIDPKFIFECPACNHEETMAIPMDVGFFSVS